MFPSIKKCIHWNAVKFSFSDKVHFRCAFTEPARDCRKVYVSSERRLGDIGLFFFENAVGDPISTNGGRYRAMVKTF